MRARRALTVGLLLALLLAGCSQPAADGVSRPTGRIERPSQLGTVPYDGPMTAQELLEHCGAGYGGIPCHVETLQAYLHTYGSVPAFSLLSNLTMLDSAVNTQAHAISHELGKYALAVYGTIERTLDECSYEVFQGCLHGALQGYFDSLEEVRPEDYRDVCPTDTSFRIYACQHGMGHGLVLYAQYDLPRGLAMCDALATQYARSSCWGGAFMENLVAWQDSRRAVAGIGHVHGDMSNVTFMIDPDDLHYPCNAVAAKYQETCWLLQTSLILDLRQGDFAQAAEACRTAPAAHVATCFRSLGRDASAWANSHCSARATQCYVDDVVRRCSHADGGHRAGCIRGAAAEVVLNFADPEYGRRTCAMMPEEDKAPCYEEAAAQGATMRDRAQMEALCAAVEEQHRDACRRGARLD